MFRVFLREKPAKVFTVLKDTTSQWHLSKIAVTTGTTYVYVSKLISSLERAGLVATEQKGKKRIAKLTERGLAIANLIEELKQKLEESTIKLQPHQPQTPVQ